jgi:RNA polymerase sigma factor (sigma-70 family)
MDGDTFVVRYRPLVAAQLRAMGARPGRDLEDLIQEVLAAANSQLAAGRFRGGSALETWLYAIGHRKFVDRCRSERRWTAAAGVSMRNVRQNWCAPDQEASLLLDELLHTLPRREAAAFRGVWIEGREIQVVASEIGLSLSRTYAEIARARNKIALALRGDR